MKSILVVDDNKINLAAARTVLSNEYRVIPVMKGTQALSYLENGECDLILLDINMPDMDGFEVLKRIRVMEGRGNIPVIFLTADDDVETETRCFKEGAVDFIAKPFVPEIMLSRVGRALELEELRRNLADKLEQKTREASVFRKKSHEDALTGLWDRVYTEETVNRLLERDQTGTLMMMDIDNFKSVNDIYGHETGDVMLKALADILRETSRREDVLCRIGGDEFVIFARGMDKKRDARDRAVSVISRVNDEIERMKLRVNISVSIGIAQFPDDGAEFAELYRSADKALYYVKRNGKNSFHFFSDKVRYEAERSMKLVDLPYLQETMSRADSGKGAYLLDADSFQYVYNFIRRFVERRGSEVSLVLFTIASGEDEKAVEMLEETIATYFRRSDVAARYSNKQSVVVLMDANCENSSKAADRILENFYKAYPEGKGRIEIEVSSLENRK